MRETGEFLIDTWWETTADFDGQPYGLTYVSFAEGVGRDVFEFIPSGTVLWCHGVSIDTDTHEHFVECLEQSGHLTPIPMAWAQQYLQPGVKPEEW